MQTGLDIQIDRLEQDIRRVRDDQHAIRAAIERMSEAVNRIALVEERQAAASQAIDLVMRTLERIDERVRKLEIDEPMQRKVSEWVTTAIWMAAVAAVMFVAAKVGLI